MQITVVRLKSLLKILAALIFATLLLINPNLVSTAAKDGLNTSLFLVVPSVFPFAVISTYICSGLILPSALTRLFSRLFKISSNAVAPFLMGLISGYPVGAILISDACFKNALSKEESEHLLPFANAAGPLFMISVVGAGMFGNVTIGYFLYLVHIASVILIFFLSRHFSPVKSRVSSKDHSKLSIIRSIDKAMNSMINVIGCITFFAVLCEILKSIGIFEFFGSFSGVFYGTLELTSGLKVLALTYLPMRLKLSLASFLCGFSGICIFLQVKNAVIKENLSCTKYVVCKLLIGLSAFILTWLLYPYIPITHPTFANASPLSPDFVSASYGFILILLPVIKFLRRAAPFFDKR